MQTEARRIVLVDDDDSARRTTELLLMASGFDVVACACDGSEAIAVLQRFVPDLVVTDLQMPHLDGLDLLAHIRSTAEFAHLPVLVFTATDKSSWGAFDHTRLTTFLQKPASMHELQQAVDALLDTPQDFHLPARRPAFRMPAGGTGPRSAQFDPQLAGGYPVP